MLIPTDAIAQRRQYLPRRQTLPRRQVLPPRQDFPRGNPVSLGIPGSDLLDSGIHPSGFALFPRAFPLAIPERMITRLSIQKGRVRKLEGGCHSSLGSSGDISISHTGVSHSHLNVPHASVSHYATSPDSSGLRRPPNRTPLCSNGSFPSRPTSLPDRLNRAAHAHPRTISLHGGTIHNNVTELASDLHTPNSWNHTIT